MEQATVVDVTLNTNPVNKIQTSSVGQPSPYHLSEEQIRFYDENGYLVLRNWIPEPLIKRLQEAAGHWIQRGWEQHQERSAAEQSSWNDWLFAEREAGTVMWRVNYLHNKGRSASLELLGSPQVLGIAESLCGPNFVPTYESMVFKQEGDGKEVIWHQDALHPRNYRIFNLDVYLDPSKEGAGGALRRAKKPDGAAGLLRSRAHSRLERAGRAGGRDGDGRRAFARCNGGARLSRHPKGQRAASHALLRVPSC